MERQFATTFNSFLFSISRCWEKSGESQRRPYHKVNEATIWASRCSAIEACDPTPLGAGSRASPVVSEHYQSRRTHWKSTVKNHSQCDVLITVERYFLCNVLPMYRSVWETGGGISEILHKNNISAITNTHTHTESHQDCLFVCLQRFITPGEKERCQWTEGTERWSKLHTLQSIQVFLLKTNSGDKAPRICEGPSPYTNLCTGFQIIWCWTSLAPTY